MIKSSDRKNTNPSAVLSCFEKGEHGPELGISFEKKDGSKRFAPYSLLCAVDSDGGKTLVFRYTFGIITVQGRGLQPIWNLLRQGAIARLCESRDISSDEASIDTITMGDFTDDPQFEPKFPEERG